MLIVRRIVIMAKQRKKRGQSTMEYILLLTGVLVVMITFLAPNGPFAKKYNEAINSATEGMANMATRLSGSRPLSS
jgi:uncharacterized protein (UPF0333 family)